LKKEDAVLILEALLKITEEKEKEEFKGESKKKKVEELKKIIELRKKNLEE
jgi:hypothetical protein